MNHVKERHAVGTHMRKDDTCAASSVHSKSAAAAAAMRPTPAPNSRDAPLAPPTGMAPGMLLGLLPGRPPVLLLLVGPRGVAEPAG